jgi:hypothetical protein
LQDPPKSPQIWIFGSKTNHLATLEVNVSNLPLPLWNRVVRRLGRLKLAVESLVVGRSVANGGSIERVPAGGFGQGLVRRLGGAFDATRLADALGDDLANLRSMLRCAENLQQSSQGPNFRTFFARNLQEELLVKFREKSTPELLFFRPFSPFSNFPDLYGDEYLLTKMCEKIASCNTIRFYEAVSTDEI